MAKPQNCVVLFTLLSHSTSNPLTSPVNSDLEMSSESASLFVFSLPPSSLTRIPEIASLITHFPTSALAVHSQQWSFKNRSQMVALLCSNPLLASVSVRGKRDFTVTSMASLTWSLVYSLSSCLRSPPPSTLDPCSSSHRPVSVP